MAEAPPPPRGVISDLGGGVIDTFKTLPPTLLLIIMLNMAFAGVGGFYLLKVEEYRVDERKAVNDLLTKCLTETVHIDFLKIDDGNLFKKRAGSSPRNDPER